MWVRGRAEADGNKKSQLALASIINSIPVIRIIINHVERKIRPAFFIFPLSFCDSPGKKQKALNPKPIKQHNALKIVKAISIKYQV